MLAQDRFPELLELLAAGDTTLTQVLDLPYITQAARFGFLALRSFVAPHSAKLLRLAFSQADPARSITAYKILHCGDAEYLRPLFARDAFLDYAMDLMSQEAPPAPLVGRLASLTAVALSELPDCACENCVFVYHLLAYCENPTVFDLFETLTSDDDRVKPAQRWLRAFGFCEYIPREIALIDFGHRSACANVLKDPVYNRASYLFQLVARGLRNAVLGDDLRRTGNLLECLRKKFPDIPDFVQAARWDAIATLATAANAGELTVFVDEALGILVEQFDHLRKFHVIALSFVTNMMKFGTVVYESIERSSLPTVLLAVVLSFPSATIFHNAFLEFIEAGLANFAFANRVVRVCVPVLATHGEATTNRILKAFCIRLMELFVDAAKAQRRLRPAMAQSCEGDLFVKHVVVPFRKTTKGPYGEDVPSGFEFLHGLL
jgi:hypothetical protein